MAKPNSSTGKTRSSKNSFPPRPFRKEVKFLSWKPRPPGGRHWGEGAGLFFALESAHSTPRLFV